MVPQVLDAHVLDSRSRSAAVVLAGAAVLVVAAFLPWSAELDGPAYTGFDHVHGYLTLGTGLVVGGVVLWREWSNLARLVAGFAALFPVWSFVKWYTEIAAESVSEPAIGLYLTLLGGLGLLGGVLYSLDDDSARGGGSALWSDADGDEQP